ncbi:MAG: ribulose-bisphosphate carboxylase large subunit [Candidatus Anstonellales archaeon]
MGYIKLGFEPDDEHLVVFFRAKSSQPAEKIAEIIAAESSVGTWTEVWTSSRQIVEKFGAKVFKLRKEKGVVSMAIAYPIGLFEKRSIPQLLSSISGNVFGVKEADWLVLDDIYLPQKYEKKFPGPKEGMEGIRRYLGTTKSRRPHVGTIIKPKLGLSAKKFAEVAEMAWRGGIDFVKDDENLTDQKFCKFEERVVKTLEALDRAEEETGEKKLYSPNITANADVMLKRADFVKEHGGNMIMLDLFTCGFSAVQMVRDQNILPIHAHRAMHGVFTEGGGNMVKMHVWAKIFRLMGVDQLHIDHGAGKMHANKEEVRKQYSSLVERKNGIKPVFPVASGGLYPTKVYDVVNAFNSTDFVFQGGGGVHGHPQGTEAGAKAMRAAVDAVAEGITLKEKAKECKELAVALEKWGGKQVYYLWHKKI